MSNELTDDEKKRLAETAMTILAPVAEEYELDTVTGRMALYKAFQLGIIFAHAEAKKIEEEFNDGRS